MKTKITILLLIICSNIINAQGQYGFTEDVSYQITGNTVEQAAEIRGFGKFESAHVNIPSGVKVDIYDNKTYTVTAIGFSAFLHATELKSISFPNTIRYISNYAFAHCTGLTAIDLPEKVDNIAPGVFKGCNSLSSVKLSNLTLNIGQFAFSDCRAIESIVIPPSVRSIGVEAFSGCSALASLNIPISVTRLDRDVFENCGALKTLKVNWTTPLVINYPIIDDENLQTTTLVVPPGTIELYKSAKGWKDFVNIIEQEAAPIEVAQTFAVDGINYIIKRATQPFEVGVTKNTNVVGAINVPTNVMHKGTSSLVTSIVPDAFWDCKFLTAVTIPSSVTSIGDIAFFGCSALKSINIPNSVTSIGDGVFNGCNALTSINIPSSVTSIGKLHLGSFGQTKNLRTVFVNWPSPLYASTFSSNRQMTLVVPAGTLATYKQAYQLLEEFTIVEKTTTALQLGEIFEIDRIFYKISKETSPYEVSVADNNNFAGEANIPRTVTYQGNQFVVTSIGYEAFRSCVQLSSVNIPTSVTKIGKRAFLGCALLSAVKIPTSVTSIGDSAFYSTGLTALSIPASVTNIEGSSFNGIYLRFVTVNWTTPIAIQSLYPNREAILIVPAGTLTLYKNASPWNQFSTIIEKTNSPLELGQTLSSNGINYIVTKITAPYEVAVSRNPSFVGAANIPATVVHNGNEFVVSSIQTAAFAGCKTLTSVFIPNSITTIGEGAFSDSSLTSIKIPNSIAQQNYNIFASCFSLKFVTVHWATPPTSPYKFYPSTTTTLVVPAGTLALYKVQAPWSGFSTIIEQTINNSTLGQVFTIDNINYIVTKDTEPYEVSVASNRIVVGNVTIPSTVKNNGFDYAVTAIDHYAFYDCRELVSVSIPNSVTSFGDQAFYQCNKLSSINMPTSLKSIGACAFCSCTLLPSVDFPTSLTSIGEAAFRSCTSLTSLMLPNALTSIAKGTFEGCTRLKSVTIPNSVTSIGDSAFSGCESLRNVSLPSFLTSIGEYAFSNCGSLKNVVNGSTINRIGAYSFSNCISLPSMATINSVTTLESAALSNCVLLTGTPNLSTITSMGVYAFGSCLSLTSVAIPSTISVIPYGAFSNCRSLTSVTIPSSITSIGDVAFFGCKSLTSLDIPNSVTTIGSSAFNSCSALTSVSIPNTITNLSTTFQDCTGLQSVTVSWNKPIGINKSVFSKDIQTNSEQYFPRWEDRYQLYAPSVKLFVPAGTAAAYRAADVWKEFNIQENTLSNADFSANNTLKFYPNPAQSQINFSQEINTLEVFDIAGKKVKSFKNAGSSYDVSSLDKGVYILKGQTTEGKSINEKLVKE